MNQIANIKKAFESASIKAKFAELLGKRSTQFVTSVLATVNNNNLLTNASWESIYQAAITAATLDLPINPNLGFSYIVPYSGDAQFQIGYKGFIQLAQRSGQFKTINVSDVREGEIEEFDRLTGQIKFSWIQDDQERIKKPIVGYVSYFELLNGFSKLQYMTKAELENHGQTFSKSYNTKSKKTGEYTGLWRTNFDAMAKKTVLKLLLSKFAPLSTAMEMAITHDQAIIKGDNQLSYADNDGTIDVEATTPKSELQKFIEEEVTTLEALMNIADQVESEEEQAAFKNKMTELNTPDQTEDGALLPADKPTTKV